MGLYWPGGTPLFLVLGRCCSCNGKGGKDDWGFLVGGNSVGPGSVGQVHLRWSISWRFDKLKFTTVPCLGQGLSTSGSLGTGGSCGLVIFNATCWAAPWKSWNNWTTLEEDLLFLAVAREDWGGALSGVCSIVLASWSDNEWKLSGESWIVSTPLAGVDAALGGGQTSGRMGGVLSVAAGVAGSEVEAVVGSSWNMTGTMTSSSSSRLRLSDRLVRLTSGGVGRFRGLILTGGGGGCTMLGTCSWASWMSGVWSWAAWRTCGSWARSCCMAGGGGGTTIGGGGGGGGGGGTAGTSCGGGGWTGCCCCWMRFISSLFLLMILIWAQCCW